MSINNLEILNQLEITILSDSCNGKDGSPPSGEIVGVLDSPGVYIIREKRPSRCYSLLKDTMELGIEGIIISREHPEKVIRNHEMSRIPMYWLSRMEMEYSISPEDLTELTEMVENYCSQDGGCIILLDGLEYLITERGFNLVLEFLYELQNLVIACGSRLIMPLHQGTLTFREYNYLEEGFTIL
ncbi:MAG: DUF835 domain-containing protein [Theionarchaea archaeon]|nr:DUF835 domain-containing protein [Theionarchaea archaeon]MBU6999162.1 DUF835 domain-containing protein [Theionarchaea archaeon]MBU7019522.1 DUF835 domain-containing protein [Theionarchaea archaeon]MBU7034955.1 DUF835 domain-containing protein [Theionarchaea archaeon]MBU7040955.1 DUF835 domain-containing protein [Theionarchaea archaeon]